jgi:hypothetical protein
MDPLITKWITAIIVVVPIVILVYLFAKHANRKRPNRLNELSRITGSQAPQGCQGGSIAMELLVALLMVPIAIWWIWKADRDGYK